MASYRKIFHVPEDPSSGFGKRAVQSVQKLPDFKGQFHIPYKERQALIKYFFIPSQFTNLKPIYSRIIGKLATMTETYAVWYTGLIPTTIMDIKSVMIVGYPTNVEQMSHLLKYFVDAVEASRYNHIKDIGIEKEARRKLGYSNDKMRPAGKVAREHWEKTISNLEHEMQVLLDNPVFHPWDLHKQYQLQEYIKENKLVNFKYSGKLFYNAFARHYKPVNKRVIAP